MPLGVPIGNVRTRAGDVDALLAFAWDPDPRVRQRAAMNLCPCHVRRERDDVWDRLIALAADPDVRVRRVALHALCDGSPRVRESEVVAAVSSMRNDPHPRLRRQVRRVLAVYRRTGRINVL